MLTRIFPIAEEATTPVSESASQMHSRGQELLTYLVNSGILRARQWHDLDRAEQSGLFALDEKTLLLQLQVKDLLTEYQAERVRDRRFFGLTLGNYRVLDRIGVGGMGMVLKAEHFQLPRLVAIKTLTNNALQDPVLLDRFMFEMEAIARLQHPNLVSAIDAGTMRGPQEHDSELRYFVMDFIDGPSLEELVKREGAIEELQACDVIYQVASALAEAHRQGLVHRDIKPSNIMIDKDGQAKLLDFGLARHHDSSLTEAGMILGTVDYLPPEQAEDASAVDSRADIFGLGDTFFLCLTRQA